MLLPRLPAIPGAIAWGGMLFPLLWTGVSYGLMGVVNPILQEHVDWPWFIISQFVFGAAAAIVVDRSVKIRDSARGAGADTVKYGGCMNGKIHHAQRHRDPDENRRASLLFSVASVPLCSLSLVILVSLSLLAGCDLPGRPDPADRPVPADQVVDFRTLYGQNCAGCHGADGKMGPAPPLNDPLFRAIVPEDELQTVITKGRHNTLMPAFAQKWRHIDRRTNRGAGQGDQGMPYKRPGGDG